MGQIAGTFGAKKRAGLLSGLVDRFRRSKDADEEGEVVLERPSLDRGILKRLKGRIVNRKGSRIVVEIVLAEGTEWTAPKLVDLYGDEQAWARIASVRPSAGTTASGSYAAGAIVRLVLEIEGDAPRLIRSEDFEVRIEE